MTDERPAAVARAVSSGESAGITHQVPVGLGEQRRGKDACWGQSDGETCAKRSGNNCFPGSDGLLGIPRDVMTDSVCWCVVEILFISALLIEKEQPQSAPKKLLFLTLLRMQCSMSWSPVIKGLTIQNCSCSSVWMINRLVYFVFVSALHLNMNLSTCLPQRWTAAQSSRLWSDCWMFARCVSVLRWSCKFPENSARQKHIKSPQPRSSR